MKKYNDTTLIYIGKSSYKISVSSIFFFRKYYFIYMKFIQEVVLRQNNQKFSFYKFPFNYTQPLETYVFRSTKIKKRNMKKSKYQQKTLIGILFSRS